jgi:hypothetical protein
VTISKRYTAPTLPLPPQDYAQTYGNELIKILRLYFDNNDATVNAIIALLNDGGYFPSLTAGTVTANQFTGGNFSGLNATLTDVLAQVLRGSIQGGNGVFNQLTGANVNASLFTGAGYQINYPHIGASGNANQYADADDDPTIVEWDTVEEIRGFTLASNQATADHAGVYKIDYSLQFVNTDNAIHDVTVWLQVNNADVARSATKFSIPARKSAGDPSYLLAYSTIMFECQAGDDFALYWATDTAYDPVGPVEGVYMIYEAAQTAPPYARPAIPASIGAIVYVSAPVPAKTQITPIGVIGSTRIGSVTIDVTNNTA